MSTLRHLATGTGGKRKGRRAALKNQHQQGFLPLHLSVGHRISGDRVAELLGILSVHLYSL
jgi:hypothetical protein